MLKVYDEVWIMENNKPTKKLIFAIIQSMNFAKNGVETTYRLVNETCGAGWGNNAGIHRKRYEIFKKKKHLIESLGS